uniref:Putative ovule protein n=1 Tax=Solanum chacoense TaxID=4108 RepID=A0A0V0IYK9_SOLCH
MNILTTPRSTPVEQPMVHNCREHDTTHKYPSHACSPDHLIPQLIFISQKFNFHIHTTFKAPAQCVLVCTNTSHTFIYSSILYTDLFNEHTRIQQQSQNC